MITLASNQRGEVACVGRERRQEGQPMGAELEHGAVVQSGRSHAQGQADRRRRGRGRADLHMHTTHSDGQPTVRQLLEYVVTRASLDVIAITDHDTIAGALEAQTLLSRLSYDLEVIVGEEVSTRDGHLVGLFLKERVSPGMSAAETVSAIHAQGGLAFAPHPFLRARQRPGKPITMVGLGTLVAGLALDAVETINATPFLDGANRRAQQFNAEAAACPCWPPLTATSRRLSARASRPFQVSRRRTFLRRSRVAPPPRIDSPTGAESCWPTCASQGHLVLKWEAEKGERSPGLGGIVAAGRGNVGRARTAEQTDHGTAEGGQGLGEGRRAHL